MMTLSFGSSLREVLVLGAHCDDVEIGCGGTLAVLARAFPEARVRVVFFAGESARAEESRAALARLLQQRPNVEIETHRFRDGFFPVEWAGIKEIFEDLKVRCRPDLIFTHHDDDRHQDHRTVCELTWNTFRDHTILEYEIPKYDGDLGRPAVFVPLAAEVAEHKIATLLECFASQREKRWFAPDVFRSLMRLRGMECNAASGFAEAFYVRKLTLAW